MQIALHILLILDWNDIFREGFSQLSERRVNCCSYLARLNCRAVKTFFTLISIPVFLASKSLFRKIPEMIIVFYDFCFLVD